MLDNDDRDEGEETTKRFAFGILQSHFWEMFKISESTTVKWSLGRRPAKCL